MPRQIDHKPCQDRRDDNARDQLFYFATSRFDDEVVLAGREDGAEVARPRG